MTILAPHHPLTSSAPSGPGADQAARLRVVAAGPTPAPSAKRHCPVVAITSGKGGVGKTTVSVNLAIALTRRSLRVILVDADPGLANADLLCGITPTTRLDAAVRTRRIGELAIEVPGGFRLIPGAAGLSSMANLAAPLRDSLVRGLSDLTRDADIVLVDTGAGLADGVTAFVAGADVALVVTTPEPPALADGYAMIKVLHQRPIESRPSQTAVFMNHAMGRPEGENAFARLSATCGRFLNVSPWLAGVGVVDKSVALAVRERRALMLTAPKSALANELCLAADQLAAKLLGCAQTPASGGRLRSFWASLLG